MEIDSTFLKCASELWLETGAILPLETFYDQTFLSPSLWDFKNLVESPAWLPPQSAGL